MFTLQFSLTTVHVCKQYISKHFLIRGGINVKCCGYKMFSALISSFPKFPFGSTKKIIGVKEGAA